MRVIILLVLIAVSFAEQHHDLHRALRHHSSLKSASHRSALHHTNHWVVEPATLSLDTASAFAAMLNRQLSAGSMRVYKVTRTGLWVLEATDTVPPSELTALLLSEQRGGTIEWFNRDSVVLRKSH